MRNKVRNILSRKALFPLHGVTMIKTPVSKAAGQPQSMPIRESNMTMNRRDFLGAATLSAGSLMIGSAQAEEASFSAPKFAAPTAEKPIALCFNENPLGLF